VTLSPAFNVPSLIALRRRFSISRRAARSIDFMNWLTAASMALSDTLVAPSLPARCEALDQIETMRAFWRSFLRKRASAVSGVPYMKFSRRDAVASHFGSRFPSRTPICPTMDFTRGAGENCGCAARTWPGSGRMADSAMVARIFFRMLGAALGRNDIVGRL
jgi:hypothetical protein